MFHNINFLSDSSAEVPTMMDTDGGSKRVIKRRAIFSPSDATEIEHSIIHVPEFRRDFLVKKSSVKYHTNGKVSIKISGRESYGDLITSGKFQLFQLDLSFAHIYFRNKVTL